MTSATLDAISRLPLEPRATAHEVAGDTTPHDMPTELNVHQDTTLNASRLSVALSMGALIALIGASMVVGRYTERLERVERDVQQRATVGEMSALRSSVEELRGGMLEVRTDLRGIRDILMQQGRGR